ncbi:MAG: TonB C-terminal domain-containing protein [Myxococcales bacterium]|nr:TonB C-terminal domain-containing protein [Myxococcales bacterium]
MRTDSGRGRTIRNDPSERPDPEALAAYDAERAKAKVDGWLADELAAHLVEVGLVDGYFQQLRHGLEQQAAPPPPFEGGPFVKQLLKEYVASAQRFGQSGNPYVEAPAVGRPDEVLSPTERFAEADRDRGPGKVNGTQTAASPVEDFRRTLRMGASLRDFADGKMSGALVAVVEIRQSAGGQLLGHLLVESSGNKLFDTHVMSTAPEAVAKLPPPPATGSGIHPEGLRSLWAFEGKVIYRKKLKDVKWDESWWYHAAMLPAGLVTGNFDEMTGDVYVVDLTDPQFVCNVRLLRVY